MRIVWTEPGERDLSAIRSYIAQDSEYYAERFVSRLVEKVRLLRGAPELGEVVFESEGRGVRQLLYRNYRILYELQPDRVLILAVVHAARDIESMESSPWDLP